MNNFYILIAVYGGGQCINYIGRRCSNNAIERARTVGEHSAEQYGGGQQQIHWYMFCWMRSSIFASVYVVPCCAASSCLHMLSIYMYEYTDDIVFALADIMKSFVLYLYGLSGELILYLQIICFVNHAASIRAARKHMIVFSAPLLGNVKNIWIYKCNFGKKKTYEMWTLSNTY